MTIIIIKIFISNNRINKFIFQLLNNLIKNETTLMIGKYLFKRKTMKQLNLLHKRFLFKKKMINFNSRDNIVLKNQMGVKIN